MAPTNVCAKQGSAAIFVMLIFAVIAAGCTQQERPVLEIKISGHPQIYTFAYDVRKTLKMPVSGKAEIQQLFASSESIDVVFDGSSQQDNAYFRVILINIVSKLQTYSINEGKILRFNSYYFVDGVWYNSTNNEIEKPALGTTIWLVGPETGAKGTSVGIDGNIITVEGTSYRNLTVAGDRLVLAIFGIERI